MDNFGQAAIITNQQQQLTDRFTNQLDVHSATYHLTTYSNIRNENENQQQQHQQSTDSVSCSFNSTEYGTNPLQQSGNSAVNLVGNSNLSQNWDDITTKQDNISNYHSISHYTPPISSVQTSVAVASSTDNVQDQAQIQTTNTYYNIDDPSRNSYYSSNSTTDYSYTNQQLYDHRNATWLPAINESSGHQHHYSSYNYYDIQQQNSNHQENVQNKLSYYHNHLHHHHQQHQSNFSSDQLYEGSRYLTYPANNHHHSTIESNERAEQSNERAGYYLTGSGVSTNSSSSNKLSNSWQINSSLVDPQVYSDASNLVQNNDNAHLIRRETNSWSPQESDDDLSAHQRRNDDHHHKDQHDQKIIKLKNLLIKSAQESVNQIGSGCQRTNQCSVCGRNYARPSTLKTHLRTHTNERPFKCSVCLKTFSQAANLTAHQRVHTGERPFSCPICGRQFSQSSSVITHLRTHSGERPYRCSMCSRTFSDSSTLTKHCRIHSGEKPYQCDHCPLNFSQSGNLSRHLKLHLINSSNNNNNNNSSSSSSSSSNSSSNGGGSSRVSSNSSSSNSNSSSSNHTSQVHNGLVRTQLIVSQYDEHGSRMEPLLSEPRALRTQYD